MPTRPGYFRLSAVFSLVFLLATPLSADDEKSKKAAQEKQPPVRVEPPRKTQPDSDRNTADAKRREQESRVVLRDLQDREGFDALQDEYEDFGRYFSFQKRRDDQKTPPGKIYYLDHPYHSSVHEYIAISEYERYRKHRDRHRREMEVRKARLLNQHERTVVAGLDLMNQGQYDRAVIAFTMASKLNQADPACLIHLAQARLAQRQYREAGLSLRRALHLQPKLLYADLQLDRYYAKPGDLDLYTKTLIEWTNANAAHVEVYFLLGFLEFQRGNFSKAHTAFKLVSTVMPKDDLTRNYLVVTEPPRAVSPPPAAKSSVNKAKP